MPVRKVANKSTGATLKLDIKDSLTELKNLNTQLQNISKNLDSLKDKEINLKLNKQSADVFKDLVVNAKSSVEAINKAFADGGKKVQQTLKQNMITTPTSPDFVTNLRDNMRKAQEITAAASRSIQASLNSAFSMNGKVNSGIVSTFGATDVNNLLSNIGGTGRNLSETLAVNKFQLMNDAVDAANVGKIARIGSALSLVSDAADAIDTGNIAAIGNAFETMDGIDTANLVRSAEAVRKIGELGDTLDLAEMVRNVDVLGRTDAFIKMADQAQNARKSVMELGKSIQTVGNVLQNLGNGIAKLGQGIQNYSNYMIKGFMAIQYTMRGVIESAVGGTSDLITNSIDQIKSLEQATIGFENYFAKKEKGFDAEVLLDRIKAEAVIAQGVNAGDLAAYISQVAPVAASSDQAFDVTMGLLKAITYSGGSASAEMPNVVKNIRDVLAKGQAYAMDINQFNRAIPGLPGILEDMGLTQFLKNGQLSITKENVNQVMAAFAKFNDPNSPVYDILEKMSTTLGGAQEMTRESITQAVANSMEQSGLLDIWKNMLKNSELQTAIQNGIDTVIRTVANVLRDIGIEHLITEIMDMVGMLGNYFGQTIVPALKTLFGLDQGASMREVVDNVIKLIGDFGKGLIDGLKFLVDAGKWIKDNILPWIQKIGQALGINGESLAQWAGFFVTAAPLLSPLVKIVGELISKGGVLVSSIGGWIAKAAVKDAGGSIASNGTLVSALSGQGLPGILGGLNIGGMLQGTAVMWAGQLLKPFVQALLGGVEKPLARFGSALTEVGSVFLGVTMAFGPIPGAIAAAIDAVVQFGQEMEYQAEQRKKERIETIAQSFKDLKKVYLETTVETMRKAGMFAEGDEATQQAYSKLVEWLDTADFSEFTDPNEALAMVMNKYQQEWALWKTGDNVIDTLNELLDPTSDSYITGTTKLNKSNVDQYGDKIRAIYDRMLELGFVGEYAQDMSSVGAYDLWKYLSKNNLTMGSTQFLEAVYSHLNDPDWLKATLEDKEVDIIYKTEGSEAADSIEELLVKNGFTKRTTELGGSAWYTEAGIKVFADIDEKTQKTLGALGLELGSLGLSGGLDLYSPIKPTEPADLLGDEVRRIVETSFPGITWEQWKEFDDDLKRRMLRLLGAMSPAFPYKSTGGFIRPVYRANGGLEMGVDTIPAMLAPGEFVQRSSAVSLAGLSVMEALNRGDLASAYGLLGAKINHNVNTHNYGNVSNRDSHNQTTNFISNFFSNRSGAIGAGRRLGTLMAHRR